MGWAIEGAIGSDFKIDASYLSPNVKLSDHLELLTKTYGVPILISGELHHVLTKATKEYCWELDTIQIHGWKEKMIIFTVDIDITRIEVDPPFLGIKRKDDTLGKKLIWVQGRIKWNRYKAKVMTNQIQVADKFI